MAFYRVTAGRIGSTLELNGVLTGIECAVPPSPDSYPPAAHASERYFILADTGGPRLPRTLTQFDPHTSPMILYPSGFPYPIRGYSSPTPFSALTVLGCPDNAEFDVYTLIPAGVPAHVATGGA
jgi:hypothetical protein